MSKYLYHRVNVKIDLDELIEDNFKILRQAMQRECNLELLQELHRVQQIHGDAFLLDRLQDLFHEYKLPTY